MGFSRWKAHMLKIIRSLLSCMAVAGYLVAYAAEPPRLALAKRYYGEVDITQYLVSEKLDGVRGYWDGKQLYSRNGNRIHTPAGFTDRWPEVHLDGELWMGRQTFEQLSGIVRRHNPVAEDWKNIRFMVFDLHDHQQAFNDRLKRLRRLITQADNLNLQLIPQREVESRPALDELLQRIVEKGGEGLMLHRKDAIYRAGRSDDILKLKPQWDAEARVIAHIPGKGKYKGMLGSLLVEGMSETKSRGKQFRIGTGFTDQQRRNPPEIGDVVTYQFQGYTKIGLPRFASFLRVRISVDM